MFADVIGDEYEYTAYDVAPGDAVHEICICPLGFFNGDAVWIVITGGFGTDSTMIDGEFDGAELPVALIAVTA
jgi:hypothetical protein